MANNNNIKLTIHRFEFTDQPKTGKIVGFLVADTNSSNATYVETFLAFEDIQNLNDKDICAAAYKKLETRINQIAENYEKVPVIIGSEFVPS